MSNDIRTETKNTKAKYSRWGTTRKYGQSFSEDPMIKRGGKLVSLKEFTNKNAIDTNIYEVLDKYRGDLKMTQAEMHGHWTAISDDLAEIKSMADALKIQNKAKETWNNLPLEIRKEFSNNKTNFLINGAKWANNKISDYNKKQEQLKAMQEAAAKEFEKQQGVVNNG